MLLVPERIKCSTFLLFYFSTGVFLVIEFIYLINWLIFVRSTIELLYGSTCAAIFNHV